MTKQEYFRRNPIGMSKVDCNTRAGWEHLMCPYNYNLMEILFTDKFSMRYLIRDKEYLENELYVSPRLISGYCDACDKIHYFYETDFNIGEIISDLNKKGYYTAYSCEGHSSIETYDDEVSNAYIYFQFSRYKITHELLELFEELPASWYLDIVDLKAGKLIIRSDNLNEKPLYLLELKEWVETLPVCPVHITPRLTLSGPDLNLLA